MNAEERHTSFSGETFKRPEGSDGWDTSARRGSQVDRLLSAGIIIETQADAINEYLVAQ